ncbi:glycosyltransferase [Bacteroides acidifaciens]|uniref:glycosyltransferase n=1 Tax=Bacteroides acidifaciens TaxID=85831 RepID=UPI0030143833
MEYNIILLYYESGHPTGVIRYIEMLKRGLLIQRKYKVHRIILTSSVFFPEICEKDGLILAKIPFLINPYSSNCYWRNKYYRIIVGLLESYLKGKKNVILHEQDSFLSELTLLFKKNIGGLILLHLHIIPWKFTLETDERTFNKMYKESQNGITNLIGSNFNEQNAYSTADKIICVSKSAQRHVDSVCKNEKIERVVIYNGLCAKKSKIKRIYSRRINILFVGRISKEKGVFALLNALQKVRDKEKKVKLTLAGNCDLRTRNRIYANYNDLEIDFLGNVSYEKLTRLYSTCSIGIIPSLHEQCSYVAIEMSMFGVPIIVSDVDALSEMFEDGVNALKIPVIFDEDFGLELDEAQLASAITRLIEDEALRQRLSTNAVKNYEENFTLKK